MFVKGEGLIQSPLAINKRLDSDLKRLTGQFEEVGSSSISPPRRRNEIQRTYIFIGNARQN